ncbi:MAG: hypothetical protein CL693_07480 [Cellvibrionaceae bacterium]|nr:hypothetical protein [Cellvibrionaceae bacterium]|tara:strand:- start:44955 stop:45737 length:783 start_codon:yes stop_codon:yes gene_type:complete
MTQSDSQLFDIIFRGDIMPGHQLPDVKKKLAQLFKADEQKINALFTGAAVPLKKNLERPSAEKYQAVLRQAGADVQISVAGKVTAKIVPNRPPRPVRANSEASAPERKMTLQERLAQQEQERERQETKPQKSQVQTQENADSGVSDFTLAPVGADLLEPEDKAVEPAVAIDVSQLSLKPQEGNLVETSELAHEAPVTIELTDYGLSELGDDLIQSHERRQIEPVEVDLPDVDLAPVGEELGQLQQPAPPPPPDTSAISLE